MRLWTLHPRYLDARGLTALWREALLARKVLRGATWGYRHHPQLKRFLESSDPPAALAQYLAAVHEEAARRGYKFNAAKIGRRRFPAQLVETRGQLLYEWRHLGGKLEGRDPARLRRLSGIRMPDPHPLFKIVPGAVREWEKVRPPAANPVLKSRNRGNRLGENGNRKSKRRPPAVRGDQPAGRRAG